MWEDIFPMNFSTLRRHENTVFSNKVLISNNKGVRKLKFHSLQETGHNFSQEMLQSSPYNIVSEIFERKVYSSLGADARKG